MLKPEYSRIAGSIPWLLNADGLTPSVTRLLLISILIYSISKPLGRLSPTYSICVFRNKKCQLYIHGARLISELFMRSNKNVYIYAAFSGNSYNCRWHGELKAFPMEDKGQINPFCQYYGCWWHGNTKNQVISSIGIGLVLHTEYSRFQKKENRIDTWTCSSSISEILSIKHIEQTFSWTTECQIPKIQCLAMYFS